MKNVNIQNGFTLIELMIVLTISALILGFTVPSFSNLMKNSRVTTYTNEFVGDINLARSEAITRARPIVLCLSANPSAINPTCGGVNQTWTSGWLIFVSNDNNNTYDVGVDTLLRIKTELRGDVSIKSDVDTQTHITYRADGTLNSGGITSKFAICDLRGESQGKQIQINPMGRPRLVTPVPVSCDSPA